MNRDVRTCAEWVQAEGERVPGYVRDAVDRILGDAPAPAKAPIASMEHHAQVRRDEERQAEEVSAEVWALVLERTRLNHRGRPCCEACHTWAVGEELEPHHLEMGAGGRTDAPHLVMALCADCHRLAPQAAHRSPRRFAISIVIPWAHQHAFPLPNRKEYRS